MNYTLIFHIYFAKPFIIKDILRIEFPWDAPIWMLNLGPYRFK
ncbi:MAG: hypothetical protein BAJALOKI3v1_90035 [Promethearchaeota archaeon]|nr:MAG: hypothetical protein BAJALOKI3v1_90035 [Candidatus Lokiarchaeota archaeon]